MVSERQTSFEALIELSYSGRFSLKDSVSLAAGASFVDAMRTPGDESDAPCLDLAFAVEGSWESVGVRVIQAGASLHGKVLANPSSVPLTLVKAQITRMLSLDVDGEGFEALAAGDLALANLVELRRGVRPLLFASPYEAAARAIIGQRLFVRQAAALTRAVAMEYGVRLEVGDRVMHAFPSPEVLSNLSGVGGLAGRKIEQLRALGEAAVARKLDSVYLRGLTRHEAIESLQCLPGIGPFSAELILLRGVGDPDAFPLQEKRLHRAMALAYHLGDSPTLETLAALSERWRPYRSWVGLLLRNNEAK